MLAEAVIPIPQPRVRNLALETKDSGDSSSSRGCRTPRNDRLGGFFSILLTQPTITGRFNPNNREGALSDSPVAFRRLHQPLKVSRN
jgi:hypothetical protein